MTNRLAFHGMGAAWTALAVGAATLDPLSEHVVAWLWLVLPAGVPLLVMAARMRGEGLPQLDSLGRCRVPRPGFRWAPMAGVLGWALLMRWALLDTAPSLSDDVFRYIWEGRVTASGGDPFDLSPLAPELARLVPGAPEWSSINHRELPAIYPPGTQWVFGGLAGLAPTVVGFKVAMVAFDLVLIAALCLLLHLRGLGVERAVLYAWHPLVVVEVASSGHYEPLALLPLVLGLAAWTARLPLVSAAAWGLAFATKYAGVCAALFAARGLVARGQTRLVVVGGIVLVVCAVGPAVPFALDGTLPVGSLGSYARDWAHNSSLHALMTAGVGFHPARLLCGGLLLAWLVKLLAVDLDPARGFFLLFVGLLLLSPVVHPWYALWVVVLLPLFPSVTVTLFSVLLPLSYLAWAAEAAGEGWTLPGWVPWIEYGLPALCWWSLERR